MADPHPVAIPTYITFDRAKHKLIDAGASLDEAIQIWNRNGLKIYETSKDAIDRHIDLLADGVREKKQQRGGN